MNASRVHYTRSCILPVVLGAFTHGLIGCGLQKELEPPVRLNTLDISKEVRTVGHGLVQYWITASTSP